MNPRTALVIVGSLVLAVVASAQRSYRLEECIAIATTNSPDLRIASIEARSSILARDEVKTTSLPSIRLEGAAVYAPHQGNFGYDPALSNGGQLTGRVTLLQPLYDGGARRLRIDQLGLDIDRRSVVQRATGHDVRLLVTQAFIEALRTRAMIQQRRESMNELSTYFDLVSTMRAAGTATQSDVLKTRVDLDAENIALARAIETDSLARIVLAQRMGIPGEGAVNIAGTLDSLPLDAIGAALGSTDSSFRNVDLKIAELDVAAGRVEVELGATERSPALVFGADAGLLTSFDNLNRTSQDRLPMLGASVGVLFGMPLSSWGAFDLRAQQRELAVDARKERLRSLSQTINAARSSLLLELRSTLDRRESLRRTIVSAHDNVAIVTSRFSAGVLGSLDVLTAHQTLRQLRSDAVDAEADLHQIIAQLARVSAQE